MKSQRKWFLDIFIHNEKNIKYMDSFLHKTIKKNNYKRQPVLLLNIKDCSDIKNAVCQRHERKKNDNGRK